MLTSYDQWLEAYRADKYKIWVKVTLSNNEERYFCNYTDWFKVKDYCINQNIDVKEIGLQYRSNYLGIDATDCDGVYLVQSLIGVMGEQSKHTYTVGKIVGDTIHKQVFMTPELVQDRTDKDPVDSCFAEGILYHHEKRKTTAV